MDGRRAKWSEIWASGEYICIQCIECTFDSHSGVGGFPIFSNLVSRKQQVSDQDVNLNFYVIQFYVVIVCYLVKSLGRIFFSFSLTWDSH